MADEAMVADFDFSTVPHYCFRSCSLLLRTKDFKSAAGRESIRRGNRDSLPGEYPEIRSAQVRQMADGGNIFNCLVRDPLSYHDCKCGKYCMCGNNCRFAPLNSAKWLSEQ